MEVSHFFKKLLVRVAPGLILRVQNLKGPIEPELEHVRRFCSPDKTAIDIGADNGNYALRMLPYSKNCFVFEPRLDRFERLNSLFGLVKDKVRIENIALSSEPGETELVIPIGDGGRASIEALNPVAELGDFKKQAVTVRTLDDYDIESVGFIKIDVEGHELQVLKGGEAMIRKHRPTILVESERRHNPNCPQSVFDWLTGLGYSGYYLIAGEWHPVAEFEIDRHQISDGVERKRLGNAYVNNFFFVHQNEPQPQTVKSELVGNAA